MASYVAFVFVKSNHNKKTWEKFTKVLVDLGFRNPL
jgi:hypothetical protein